MTAAQGLGVWRNGSGKRLPGPLSHFLSGAQGGEETPREGEIRFHNTGLGGAARAGGSPPLPPAAPFHQLTLRTASAAPLGGSAAPGKGRGGGLPPPRRIRGAGAKVAFGTTEAGTFRGNFWAFCSLSLRGYGKPSTNGEKGAENPSAALQIVNIGYRCRRLRPAGSSAWGWPLRALRAGCPLRRNQ